MKDIELYFAKLTATISKVHHPSVHAITDRLLRAFENQQTVYVFGNGGSASLASHFACDLAKGTINGTGKRFRVVALTDNLPLITAWANDSSYDDIFAEQLANLVQPNDVVFAISASGNSRNVIKALRLARSARAATLGITGFQGGLMKDLCDQCVIVPSDNMQIIEDIHLSLAHAIFTAAKARTCTAAAASA
jgi:D-sedoheptulose 7-phosphate isomerase